MASKDRERLTSSAEEEEEEGAIRAYWRKYAEVFAAPLSTNGMLASFVTNPAVTGAYAEAWVRRLVESMVQGLKVSTGAVVRTTDVLKKRDLKSVPQSDLIIWDPTTLPAVFQSGDFALVHTLAARGVIEIKRTVSDLPNLQSQLRKQRYRLLPEYRRNVLGVVVAHRKQLFTAQVEPAWVEKVDRKGDVAVTRLLQRKSSRPDVDGVFALIYFLSYVVRERLGAKGS